GPLTTAEGEAQDPDDERRHRCDPQCVHGKPETAQEDHHQQKKQDQTHLDLPDVDRCRRCSHSRREISRLKPSVAGAHEPRPRWVRDDIRHLGDDMSWKWIIRSRDGGMNGLEFACATTEGGTRTVLVHAAPAQATVEVRDEADAVVARGEADACGPSTPMSLVELGVGAGTRITRREVWPTEGHY